MSTDQKKWHPHFVEYMKKIINHPNYRGLPIKKKSDGSHAWIATATSDIGKQRIDWCIAKGNEINFIDDFKPYPGMYADVMLAIHPTKSKVCQICGNEMSLYYHYPNINFLKSLNNHFGSNFSICDHISDIWDELISNGFDDNYIATYLINTGSLKLNANVATKNEIITALEYSCRKGEKKCLGPGAMSNFPDRYDGFHTYNRCCRAIQDKGRSKENLKSYSKDRRAYEYWSDGNIHAANEYMGSNHFTNTSADHIGPISLGFVHDPRYLQAMAKGDNSSKRDRLQVKDIEDIIKIEKQTNIYPMSWYSKHIWEYIKNNYTTNTEKVPTFYRNALKQNMANFMYILYKILDSCPLNGEKFLKSAFLEPKYEYFKHSYSYNPDDKTLIEIPRHITTRAQHETDRYSQIAINSVYLYNQKNNRNTKHDLTDNEILELNSICSKIESDFMLNKCKELVIQLVEKIENRIIHAL